MILTVTLNPCIHKYVRYRSDQATGTVVRPVRQFFSPGGKGLNAARVIQQLGGEAVALSTAGGVTGELLRECLLREGIEFRLVPVSAATRMSTCLLDEATASFREYLEAGDDVTADEEARLREAFGELLDRASVVTLNGSSPGARLDPLFGEFGRLARDAGRTVILDTWGGPLEPALAVPPHWVRANRDELIGESVRDDPVALEGLLERLCAQGGEGLVISDGPRDIECLCGQGRFRVRPPAVQEVNPVGSGDSLTGAFALALERGESLEEALRWGAAAGSANAGHLVVGGFEHPRFLELRDRVSIERVG